MSLYAWAMTWFCKATIRGNDRIRRILSNRDHSYYRMLAFLQVLSEAKLAQAALCLLIDFQEAQCFFIAATSMVSLYADTQPATFHSAQNLSSLTLDQSFAIILGGTGALQIMLTQISLHRVGMESVYSLVICTISLTLAGFAALSSSSLKSVDRYSERFQRQNTIQVCGGNPSLRTMCNQNPGFANWLSDERRIFFYFIPLGILWLTKALHHVGWPARIENRTVRHSHPTQRNKITIRAARACLPAMKILLLVTELSLLPQICVGVFQARGVATERNASDSSPDDTPWSFGQVTAMLIWLPVIVKYFYVLFCKLF